MLNCSICQDGINCYPADRNYPWVLSCGHVYHKTCIAQSLHSNRSCPICRIVPRSSFRLYLEEQNREETLTFLQDCVQNTEEQYARQKKLCQSKDSFIRELQTALEEGEERLSQLRTTYVNYVANVTNEKERYNDEIRKLQEEKRNELKKLQDEKQKQYEEFRVQLEVETGLFTAMCQAKMETERKMAQEILSLRGEVADLKQEILERERARLNEIEQLHIEMDNRMSEIKKWEGKSMPSLSLSASEGIDFQEHLEQTAELSSFDLSLRKRKNTKDSFFSGSEREESSVKQLRLEFGDSSPLDSDTDTDTEICIVKSEDSTIPKRSRLKYTRKALKDATLDGPVIEIE